MFITSFGEQNITYKCCSNFLIHLCFLFGKFYEIVFRGCAKFLLKIMTTQDGKSTRRKIISYALSVLVQT
ncbi:hypothetical protein Ahae2126ch_08240 [Acinetobacter haemolyticus]|nr:hypothetical protein Ahae2126ch_08240 [Acinetobacter haemolyticus]